jgi:hypothetical protein
MIYNLVQYLNDNFPGETIYRNVRHPRGGAKKVPARCVLVREQGGDPKAWDGFTQQTFQILTRDKDMPKARELAYGIYKEIHDRYGLILPADTIDGTIYPAIQTAQITGINLPQSIGNDDNGYAEYSTNYTIIYELIVR